MTFRRPYQGHILRHFMLAATVPLFQGKGESLHLSPAAVPLSLEAVLKLYVEGPWEQRLSLEQQVLVRSQSCTCCVPPPAPPSHHCTLLPALSQNSCRSWLC